MTWGDDGARETPWGWYLALIAVTAAIVAGFAWAGLEAGDTPEPVPCVSRSVMR